MNEIIKQLLKKVKEYLIELYGEKIKAVILYGSYARDEATRDSDVDILVVVDDSLTPFLVRENLSGFLFDIFLEKGELLSVIVVSEYLFRNYNFPFMLNVKKEGITA